MDIVDQKELSKKLCKLYIKTLPQLKKFEQERSSVHKMKSSDAKAFKNRIKQFMLSEIKDIFGIKVWNKGKEEDNKNLSSLILESGIEDFHHTNNNSIEEYIVGSYKGVPFKIWDMVDKLVIEFQSNKIIQTPTHICTKGIINEKLLIFLMPVLCFLAFFVHLTSHFDIIVLIKMVILISSLVILGFAIVKWYKDRKNILEDPVFSKKYHVFSEDPVEARYLITTNFMERFQNLENKLNTKHIQCVFFRDSIIFAIDSKTNRFELCDTKTKVDSPEQFRRFFEEFTAIISMIDYFKLDEKTAI